MGSSWTKIFVDSSLRRSIDQCSSLKIIAERSSKRFSCSLRIAENSDCFSSKKSSWCFSVNFWIDSFAWNWRRYSKRDAFCSDSIKFNEVLEISFIRWICSWNEKNFFLLTRWKDGTWIRRNSSIFSCWTSRTIFDWNRRLDRSKKARCRSISNTFNRDCTRRSFCNQRRRSCPSLNGQETHRERQATPPIQFSDPSSQLFFWLMDRVTERDQIFSQLSSGLVQRSNLTFENVLCRPMPVLSIYCLHALLKLFVVRSKFRLEIGDFDRRDLIQLSEIDQFFVHLETLWFVCWWRERERETWWHCSMSEWNS